jgi:hypothetical protein
VCFYNLRKLSENSIGRRLFEALELPSGVGKEKPPAPAARQKSLPSDLPWHSFADKNLSAAQTTGFPAAAVDCRHHVMPVVKDAAPFVFHEPPNPGQFKETPPEFNRQLVSTHHLMLK